MLESAKRHLKAQGHRYILLSIYLGGLLLFALLLFFVHRVAHSDDYVFPEQIRPYSTVVDWVMYRYHSWSGRIFAESFVYIFSPLPLIFWKIVSFILYGLFSGFLFMYYLLIARNRSHLKDYAMMGLALILPLTMDYHTLSEGMLWVSGSMNYFWLAAFALVAFYPVAFYTLKRQPPHWGLTAIGGISAIVAASSHEQIGAVLSVLSVFFLAFVFFLDRKRRFPVYLIIFATLFIGSFLVGITAPGNRVRIAAETITWIPDFYTVPILNHINDGYRWFIDSVINRFGLAMVLAWLLLVTLFYDKIRTKSADLLDYAITAILAISCLFVGLHWFDGIGYLFNFYATWGADTPTASLVIGLLWSVPLVATLIAPLVLYRRNAFGYLLSSLIAATFATTALITLSPTMYASGFRTLYVPSLLAAIVAYLLFTRTFDRHKKFSLIVVGALGCIAAAEYLMLLAK